MYGKSTSIDNSISQTAKSVKNNTAIKQSMQNDENNTQEQKNIQKELHNRIANALLSKNTKKNTYLGEVTEKVAKKVKSLLGIDITGRKHMLSDRDIRHIINQHGNPEIEKTKGQIAITRKDIEKIPDIINNFDEIIKGSQNKNRFTKELQNSIRYIKKYDNNILYVVEVVPNNSKQLEIKTMWKTSTNKNKKNNPVSVGHDNIILPDTSKTKPNSDYSTTSIPQNTPNVKNNGVRAMKTTKKYNNYTQKELDNLNSPKIRIANSEKDVLNFIETAKKIPNNLKLYFGKISNNTSKKIRNTLGIKTDNYNISLRANTITHILKEHGNAKTEALRGQLPITEDDMLNIPYIINNYDNLKNSGVSDKNKPSITFEKNIAGNTVVVTYVSDKHHNLEVQTMYKFKNNKGASATGTNATNALVTTSKTDSGTKTPNTSVAQNSKNVKNDGIGNMKTNNSNQLKNSNNANSTYNKNIRFAKRTAKPKEEVIEPGATNAQRDTNYIEQEIRKIEEAGKWDESIPVTKMTDIRKTIEDYLGLGIQKGHFRQQAYGIYKGNRDVIRTKELKDIDTILHETGHALDIGKRIKIDKESIANELLKAVNNYGGYETESREIRLEEGFAEVIRMYTIVPEQAKFEYPQTVSILEGIRKENADFDNFIRKVQEQTYNYIHQRPRNRGGLSNMSIGEQTDKMPLTPESIRQKIIENAWDFNYSIKRAVEVLQEKGNSQELRASDSAYLLTRLSSGIGDKITSILSNGYIDENGNKLFPGLNQLGELLDNDIERFNDLRAYLVAQRDLEYKAKKLKTGIRTMDSKAIVEEFKDDTQIQEASKIIYDTLDGVLQYAVNNKLITPDNAKALRESNTFYVPMQRVLGTSGNNVGRKGAVADIIRARTGSELDIKDVLENIVTNSANIIQQVENNLVIKALYNQGESVGLTGSIYDEIDPPMKKIGTDNLETWKSELKSQGVDIDKIDFDKTIDIFVPNNNIDEKNQIVSFIDNRGQRRYLQFHDEILFKTLTGLDRESTSRVLTLFDNLNKPLRYGATLANLGFALPNMLSDTVQASIYSEAGFIPVIDTAIGTLDVLASKNKTVRNFMKKVAPKYADRVNMMYYLYEQSGATSATKIGQERKSAQMLMKDIYGTNNSETLGIKDNFKPLKRLLDIMTYIPELSEQSTRFRVFEKNLEYYRRNGMEEIDARIQAALQSRDATQDFSRMGKSMREVNKLVPFSAARVGSSYTFLENFQANPKRTSARIAVLMAISMGIKALTSDDDEINELNQRKKDDNFVFKIGDQIVTIKKPQGILRSMINLSDYIIDLASGNIEEGKEGERLAEWLCNAIMDNSISDDVTGLVPSAITPIVENAINKDFYYNTDIVKSYDLELPDSEQYYDYNSQLAIWLGKIFNYSPAKIDNFISGYFAGLGTQVTNIIDWILSQTGVIPEKPNMGLESNSIGKRFFINTNTNSASVDELYDLKTELTKKKNGNTITDEETQQLEDINNSISNITKLNKQIKEIKKDLKMSGEEKAEKIKILQKQKTDLTRKTLGKELLYPENGTDIESITFYPSRDTLSQNGYVLNLTSDMKKEYEQLAYNKYKQYESHGLYSKEKLEKLKEKSKDYAKSQLIKKYKNALIKK